MKIRKTVYILSYATVLSMLIGGCKSADVSKNPADTQTQVTSVTEETELLEEIEPAVEEAVEEAENAEEMMVEDDTPALRDSYELGGYIGCAVTGNEIDDEGVWNIITKHFNAVTLGNELKPDAIFKYSNDRCPGTQMVELNGEEIEVPVMSFARAERILNRIYDWNEANPDRKIMVRGHVLVWHSQTPEWFFHENYNKRDPYVSKEEMDKRLEWYIKAMFEHFFSTDSKYKDMFYGWDVVNEAVSDKGGYRTDEEKPSEPLSNNTHSTNSSWWHVYQSNEYIINAFKYANKYAPSELELYYNDYNETEIVKRNGIVDLLTAVKEAEGEPGVGTRISGMGMQGHYGMDQPSTSNVDYSIKEYSKIVDSVQITEFDMTASDSFDGSDESKEEEYEKQRKRYNVLYFSIKSAASDPDVNVTGITFWGTVDQYSWLQNRSDLGGGNKSGLKCCPLLFDENYKAKPCFYVFASKK